jgi:hypothetical protein
MAADGSTTKQASADGDSGVHRLRDIVVEEVSLVDRAANKRRFLVVKRSSQMAGDDKAEGRGTSQEGRAAAAAAQGGKKTKPKPGAGVDKARRVMRAASDDDDEDEDEETEKARRSAEEEDDEEEDETEKARRSPQDEEDKEEDEETEKARRSTQDKDDEDSEATEKADDEEEEEDESKAGKARSRAKRGARDGAKGDRPRARAGTAEKADDELVLPATVKNAVLRVLAQALERLLAVANQVKEADAPGDDTEPNVPDDLAEELEDIGELLEDVGDQLEAPAAKAEKKGAAKGRTAKGNVAKAGRRMARDRLDRFQKALEALSSILKELTEAKASPGPSAGSAAGPLAKRNVPAGLGELVTGLEELTRVVKQQEVRLAQMQRTGATSNAIPVEGSRRVGSTQDASWPLDMNRPISRDRVDKAVSFYDEE